MTDTRCTTCPRPIPDTAFGCSYCAADLAQRLDQLAAFLPELDTTVAKQDRIGSGGPKASGAEIDLPYRPKAAEKRDFIRNELVTRSRMVIDLSGREPRGGSSSALARFLGESVEWARYAVDRQQPLWPEFHASLRPLAGSVLHLIDRPEEKTYLGPCNTVDEETGAMCTVDVLARTTAVIGVCRACGAEHNVAEAKRWLLTCLEDRLGTPDEIRGIMGRMGMKIAYSTLASYVAKGIVQPKGQDTRGRDVFRIGDVVDYFEERLKFGRRSEEALAS